MRYVGGQTKYGLMPNCNPPNVWPMKLGMDSISLEASILECGGFKVSCFEEYLTMYPSGPNTDHPTT